MPERPGTEADTPLRLLRVNIGAARPLRNAGKSGETGIFKEPTPLPVEVGELGLDGDVVRDRENHGGRDQAVYVYGTPDYDIWSEALGRELPPGTFGENLTIRGLRSALLNVGDRMRIGTAVLQVTAPRIPCATLSARMQDPAFVKRFRHAELPGAYCRVLREGIVRAGDAVSLEPYRGETISILQMFRDFFDPYPSEITIRRQLAAPIASRARHQRERQLEAMLSRGGR